MQFLAKFDPLAFGGTSSKSRVLRAEEEAVTTGPLRCRLNNRFRLDQIAPSHGLCRGHIGPTNIETIVIRDAIAMPMIGSVRAGAKFFRVAPCLPGKDFAFCGLVAHSQEQALKADV